MTIPPRSLKEGLADAARYQQSHNARDLQAGHLMMAVEAYSPASNLGAEQLKSLHEPTEKLIALFAHDPLVPPTLFGMATKLAEKNAEQGIIFSAKVAKLAETARDTAQKFGQTTEGPDTICRDATLLWKKLVGEKNDLAGMRYAQEAIKGKDTALSIRTAAASIMHDIRANPGIPHL